MKCQTHNGLFISAYFKKFYVIGSCRRDLCIGPNPLFSYCSVRCHFVMIITARERSLGQGNIFAPVCHSVHRGGGTWAGTPQQVQPPGRYTPRAGTPPGRYTPWAGTPPWAMHAGIRSTSGRYTSYWNAFLF